MDPRLEVASHAGDLDALHRLLQEDRLLLDRPTTIPTDNPLHIAAMLGYADFAREILRQKPSLARDLNAHGLSPLHLASASGHLPVVRELLKDADSDLCLGRDKDGLMPIHSAASKGRVHVLRELMEACSGSARELTYRGDTVLHLAVKSNCFEAVEFLVERMDQDEVLNSKDEKGNTALHLATARRQHQTTKFLLTKPGMDVNAANLKGLTALDALLESPSEQGDLVLGEMIRAAGGKTASEREPPQPAERSPVRVNDPVTRPRWKRHLLRAGRWLEGPFASQTEPRSRRQRAKPHPDEENSNTPGILMVVAILIATITFQAGLNPPGAFDSKTGKAVLGENLRYFLIPDMIGLFASLSIILLFICVVPRRKRKLTRMLLWVMWLAVYSTAIAFSAAAYQIFPDSTMVTILLQGWFLILAVTILSVYLRFVVYLLRMVGWWKMKPGDAPQMGAALVIKRILVVAMVIGTPSAVTFSVSGLQIETIAIWAGALLLVWYLIFAIPILWVYIRFVIYLLGKVGWWKKPLGEGESNVPRMGAALVIKRILVLVMIAASPYAGNYTIAVLNVGGGNGLWEAILLRCWFLLFGIPIVLVSLRFIRYLLRLVGWWKKQGDGESEPPPPMDAALFIKRTLVIVTIAGPLPVGLYFYSTVIRGSLLPFS